MSEVYVSREQAWKDHDGRKPFTLNTWKTQEELHNGSSMVWDKHRRGEPYEVGAEIPPLYWRDTVIDGKVHNEFDLGHFCYARQVPLVSETVVGVLQDFDMSGGGVVPAQVLCKDNVTPIPGGPYYWLNIGNLKEAFCFENSIGAKRYLGNEGVWVPRPTGPFSFNVYQNALEGSDIWIDPTCRKAIFMSGRLVNALAAAGCADDFYLERCVVVSNCAGDE